MPRDPLTKMERDLPNLLSVIEGEGKRGTGLGLLEETPMGSAPSRTQLLGDNCRNSKRTVSLRLGNPFREWGQQLRPKEKRDKPGLMEELAFRKVRRQRAFRKSL